MVEILSGQTLELENLMSFRGKITQTELEVVGKDLETKITLAGAKRVGNPVTATFEVDGNLLDIEILLPIDKKIPNIEKYSYKEKLRITNALVAKHKGNPMGLQETCIQLNQYIMEQKLVPITVGYNVTKKIDPINVEDSEVDIYVGISPNIL